MKNVKLVCPSGATIEVDEAHAERILALSLNKIAQWKRADAEPKKDAERTDIDGDKRTPKKSEKQGKAIDGSKPRGKAKTT